jgi:hypothetical protein
MVASGLASQEGSSKKPISGLPTQTPIATRQS